MPEKLPIFILSSVVSFHINKTVHT